MKGLISLTFLLLLLGACNPTKRSTHTLDGSVWLSTSYSISGSPAGSLQLSFDECDPYDELCQGILTATDHSEASFIWQVQDKGNLFELSYQGSAGTLAATQCAQLSGLFEIRELTKTTLVILSAATQGFPGQLVEIHLEIE